MNMMVSTAVVGATGAPIAVLGSAANETSSSAKAEDQIFGLIENHKRIAAEYDQAVRTHDEGDPDLEPLLETLGEAEIQAGIDLINDVPTTAEGALALLRYAIEVEAKGYRWPDGLLDDEQQAEAAGGKIRIGRPWEYFLHRNLAETLQSITA